MTKKPKNKVQMLTQKEVDDIYAEYHDEYGLSIPKEPPYELAIQLAFIEKNKHLLNVKN